MPKQITNLTDVIGSSTTVTPELVINKSWQPNTSPVSSAMIVNSDTFYNYFGAYMAPDDCLSETPYNDDLTSALDRETMSSPGPMKTTMIIDDSKQWGYSGAHSNNTESLSNYKSPDDGYNYAWGGNWGEGSFETSATFQIDIELNPRKQKANGFQMRRDTGARLFLAIGYLMDKHSSDTYTSGPGETLNAHNAISGLPSDPTDIETDKTLPFKKFLNPLFKYSKSVKNGTKLKDTFIVEVSRVPFDNNSISFYADLDLVGSSGINIMDVFKNKLNDAISSGLNSIVDAAMPSLSITIPGVSGVVGAIRDFVKDFIRDMLKKLVELFLNVTLIGPIVEYFTNLSETKSDGTVKVTLINRKILSIDGESKYVNAFGDTAPLYGQLYYENIMDSPFYPASSKDLKYPTLKNINANSSYVIDDEFTRNTPLVKKYQYFTPNMYKFCFETNIGVFLEYYATTYHTKSVNYALKYNTSDKADEVLDDPVENGILGPCLADLVYPSNNIKIQTELLGDGTNYPIKAKSLHNTSDWPRSEFSSSATAPSFSGSIPAPYASTYSDYSIGTAASSFDSARLTAINNMIGDPSTLLQDANSHTVQFWTNTCNTSHTGLRDSSGTNQTPVNLSYKLIEFAVWYLNPETNYAREARNAIKSLYQFEEQVTEWQREYSELDSATTLEENDYHAIGDTVYERNCK